MWVVHAEGEVICTCPETTQKIEVHVFLDKYIGVLGYIRVPLASSEITPFTQLSGCIEILRLVVSGLVKTLWNPLELNRRRSSGTRQQTNNLYTPVCCVCVCLLLRELKVEYLHVNVVEKQVFC